MVDVGHLAIFGTCAECAGPSPGTNEVARSVQQLIARLFRKSTFDSVPEPRRLRDPRALTAVAHPVRMGIIELLTIEGAMTATELADRLDESPANCSWHLRKLAEHDFIEEAAGGTGRQRPWQMRHVGMSWAEDDDVTGEELRAGHALSRMLLERWVDRFLSASEREVSGVWRDSSRLTQKVAWLTPEELADVTAPPAGGGQHLRRPARGRRPSRGLAAVRDRRLGRAGRGRAMKAAFAQPGFRRLFAGLSTSMLGDSIMLLVLSIWVKTLTGSSAMAGFTFFFMCIPAIFAPLAGAWLDRVRRKPLLVWGNIASAVAVLPLLLVRDAGDVWIIWTVAALYGVSFVVLPAGLNGLLKELMPEELLVDANSSLQTIKESYRLFGPLLGAGALRLDRRLGRGRSSTPSPSSSRRRSSPRSRSRRTVPEPEHGSFWVQLTGGVRHLIGDRDPRPRARRLRPQRCWCSASASRRSSRSPTTSRRPPTFVSVLVSVQGIGAVVGGLSSPRVVRRLGEVGASVARASSCSAPALSRWPPRPRWRGCSPASRSSVSRCRSSSCPT